MTHWTSPGLVSGAFPVSDTLRVTTPNRAILLRSFATKRIRHVCATFERLHHRYIQMTPRPPRRLPNPEIVMRTNIALLSTLAPLPALVPPAARAQAPAPAAAPPPPSEVPPAPAGAAPSNPVAETPAT